MECFIHNYVCISCSIVAKQCSDHVKTLDTKLAPPHTINRIGILANVFTLFSNNRTLKDYPLKIHFVGDRGIDTGVVCWDMLAEFWQVTFKDFFDGLILLVPAVHVQSDMSAFHILGIKMSGSESRPRKVELVSAHTKCDDYHEYFTLNNRAGKHPYKTTLPHWYIH